MRATLPYSRLAALALGLLIGCQAPDRGITLEVDQGALPDEALAALAGIESTYAELFGVEPTGLGVELVRSEFGRPGYDYFDAERNVVRMGWSDERAAYSLWTLAHELAHAYQFRFDPEAYAREPSWIHEGLAEYAVWSWKQAESRTAGFRFLSRAERDVDASGVDFGAVFEDVYAFDWQVAYPACLLVVHDLAERRGVEAVLDYFASHGRGDPEREFERAFNASPAAALARALASGR